MHTHTHVYIYCSYLEELEEEQLRLAMALSASMEGGGNVVYEGESSHDDQRKGRKKQKR